MNDGSFNVLWLIEYRSGCPISALDRGRQRSILAGRIISLAADAESKSLRSAIGPVLISASSLVAVEHTATVKQPYVAV